MAAFGIDLGDTYSCVAWVDDSGRATALKNAVGEYTTPSVVYFEAPDSVVVGRAAKDLALIAPELVAAQARRCMGADVHWTITVSGTLRSRFQRSSSGNWLGPRQGRLVNWSETL